MYVYKFYKRKNNYYVGNLQIYTPANAGAAIKMGKFTFRTTILFRNNSKIS